MTAARPTAACAAARALKRGRGTCCRGFVRCEGVAGLTSTVSSSLVLLTAGLRIWSLRLQPHARTCIIAHAQYAQHTQKNCMLTRCCTSSAGNRRYAYFAARHKGTDLHAPRVCRFPGAAVAPLATAVPSASRVCAGAAEPSASVDMPAAAARAAPRRDRRSPPPARTHGCVSVVGAPVAASPHHQQPAVTCSGSNDSC